MLSDIKDWGKKIGLKLRNCLWCNKLHPTNFLKIFLFSFLIFVSNIYLPEKSFAVEKSQYTFKDMVQNFFINREKCIDAGKWTVLNDGLLMERNGARAHLLPDGNVLIFGGDGLYFKENSAEIYDTKKQKVIGIIQIDTDKRYQYSRGYNTISLKNGDVYVAYDIRIDLGFKPKTKEDFKRGYISKAQIFNCKTYTFREVKSVQATKHKFILLNDGTILMLSDWKKDHYIYNPLKNEYIGIKPPNGYIGCGFIFSLRNGDVLFYGPPNWYIFQNNKIEKYSKSLPKLAVQIDYENALDIDPKYDCTIGNVYNIEEEKITPVINKIDKTWGANPNYPKFIVLDNKNVLILGAYANKRKEGERKKYTTYLYNFKKNKFYKIPNPPIYISKDTASVKLENGDILFVGGQLGKKMMIYSYKH